MQEVYVDQLKELTEVYRNTVQLAQKLVELNSDLNNTLNKAVIIGEKLSAIQERLEKDKDE
jgi:hypothetical protein